MQWGQYETPLEMFSLFPLSPLASFKSHKGLNTCTQQCLNLAHGVRGGCGSINIYRIIT